MINIALFPGLDGTGDLYQALITQLDGYSCQVFSYPEKLIDPQEIANYIVKNNDFSKADLFVAESFGCRVLIDLLQIESIENKPSVFIAGFGSINARYKLLAQGPDFLLRAFYKKAANRFALRRYCLGNTKNESLVTLLQKVLASVPYEIVIGRLRFLAKYPFESTDKKSHKSKFILAKADKLLSSMQQKQFAIEIESDEIIELNAPHFIAQTNAAEVAQIIIDSLKA